jgi:hypothetical protein
VRREIAFVPLCRAAGTLAVGSAESVIPLDEGVSLLPQQVQ